jgi:sugar-specific transcriptional regulator TrmB/DNA-binding CsgD family transcriptional regulator
LLRAVDIGEPEQSVYLALLKSSRMSEAELADQLELTPGEVRESIRVLRDRGLIRESLEQPDDVAAVSPQVGLQSLLAQKRADLARRASELAECEAVVARLVHQHSSDPASYDVPGIQRLSGLDAIRRRLEEVASSTQHELLSLAPDGPQSATTIAASKPLDEMLLARGVRMRSVFLDSIRNDGQTVRWAEWLGSIGGEVRFTSVLPLRLKIYDRRIAVVPVNADRSGGEALQVEIPGLITALLALFDEVWQSARTVVESGRSGDAERISEQERHLLSLLAHGQTDDGVARKLGVSVRTCRRMLADIMERLQAKSRFDAAVRATELGWVSSPPPGIRVSTARIATPDETGPAPSRPIPAS